MRTSIIVDIVIVVILLLSFYRGFKKGFFKRILAIVTMVATIALAFFLVSPVKKIFEEPINNNISKIESYLSDKNDIYQEIVTVENSDELLREGLNAINIPSLFNKTVLSKITIEENTTLAHNLAPAFNSILMSIIIFLTLLILFTIIFLFIKKIFGLITSVTPLSLIDKLIGAAVSFSIALLFISLILLIVPVLLRYNIFSFSHEFITNALELNSERFTITKFLYEHNPILYALSLIKTKL